MSFQVPGDSYDRFMGRWSVELAPVFADYGRVEAGQQVLDVGCGSGVLTAELARRVGEENVAGVDPSPLLEACRDRVPGADLRQGAAEDLPWADDSFDAALAQLVVHFMADPVAGVAEMARVTRPGGAVAACTWDFADGMEMLRIYWESARAVDPDAPSEERLFGRPEELLELWRATGLEDAQVEPLEATRSYEDFHELWNTFLLGAGPSGQFLIAQEHETQEAIRREYFGRLGEPRGRFELRARAWAARGRVT
ncbi:MAG TPA: class I SAM-dependent methyltransferase [Gaiellaceae bacterium]|nr:class I SAM-dependent methyltransferase [Gaiellaceae bacterium]